MTQRALLVELFGVSFPLHGTHVVAALRQANERVRLPGLADHLNPHVVDVDRFERLMAAVGDDVPVSMRTMPLFLDPVALRVAASSPVLPDAVRPRERLRAAGLVGDAVRATSAIPYDPGLARGRAAEARRFVDGATAAIAVLDASRTPAAVDRLRRYRAALAWRENAQALVSLFPDDPAARVDADGARKAVVDHQLLGGSQGR